MYGFTITGLKVYTGPQELGHLLQVTRAETRDICSGGKTETSSSEFKTSPYETETFQAENETKTEKQKKILRPS